MSLFILVHGGFYGGWCWRDVKSFLQNEGHQVFAPTLTGLGERKHLNHANVGIETHIQDITNLILYENLNNINLVGHSYGGLIVAGVASLLPERINQLIYLDALIPQNGDSVLSLVDKQLAEYFVHSAQSQGDGWLIPPFLISEPEYLKDQVLWCNKNVTGQSLKTFTDKLKLNDDVLNHIYSTYIHCSKNTYPMTKSLNYANKKGWHCLDLEKDHLPMITAPTELACMLFQAAKSISIGNNHEEKILEANSPKYYGFNFDAKFLNKS